MLSTQIFGLGEQASSWELLFDTIRAFSLMSSDANSSWKRAEKKRPLKDYLSLINDIALWLGLVLAVATMGGVLLWLFLLDPLSRF